VHAGSATVRAAMREATRRSDSATNVVDHGVATVVTAAIAFGPVLACRYGHP
jgi:hypothetical protein